MFVRLLWDLVVKDLQARYRTSSMGFFWSLVNPVVMLLLFWFLFGRILHVTPPPGVRSFALFILSGILPWFAIQEALYRSATSILDNAPLVKTIRFPILVLPLYLVISGLINELIGIALLVGFSVYIQGAFSPIFLLILPVLALQGLFCLGLGCILAVLQAYVRDTVQLLGVVLMIWMYLSPVFYPASLVPADYALFLNINPLHYLLSIYRSLLLQFSLPAAQDVAAFAGISLLLCAAGLAVMKKRGRGLADLV